MTPEYLRQFRINLLLQAREAGRFGLSVNAFLIGAKSAGFRSATAETVREEIDYLQDKEQLDTVPQEISPEVESFRVTATGRDWLASQQY